MAMANDSHSFPQNLFEKLRSSELHATYQDAFRSATFEIGYRSLSQFNRSFARLSGRSPTRFRTEELASLIS